MAQQNQGFFDGMIGSHHLMDGHFGHFVDTFDDPMDHHIANSVQPVLPDQVTP
jgi:hypothetical protein